MNRTYTQICRVFYETPSLASDPGGGSSGPDMSEVISTSLEGIDRGPTEVEAVAPAPAKEEAAPPDPTEEAELSKLQAEILAKNPGMAHGKINVDRHQAVLTRNRNLLQKQIEERDQQLKDIAWAKDPEIRQALQALALAETDQKAFIQLLMQDPRFADLIAFKEAQKEAAKDPNEGRPGPNKASEDGSYKYYDEQGLQQLLAWERQQTVKEAQAEWLKEFGPIKDEFEQRNLYNRSKAEAGEVLATAREQWKGFADNEPAIKQSMIANPRYTLHDAYRSVVVEKYASETKVNREKLRAEILAEINGKKPAATTPSLARGVEREASPDGKVDLEEVIRRSLPSEGR